MARRRRGRRRIGKRVSCSAKAYKMSTRRGPRCVQVCIAYGGWKIPRFAKNSKCRSSKARSWRSIAGGR